MDWLAFVGVVVGATIACSFTDWLFMGILFHDRYKATPETWRTFDKAGERNKIILSTLLGGVSSAAFAYLLVRIGAADYRPALCWAIVVWLAGPATVVAINALWVRMDYRLAVSHSIGWLARFVVTGMITAALM